MKNRFDRLTCNFVPAGCRIDTLEGKEYTVVPMVMLTEGVHCGSQGPLYYPAEEVSKVPATWNHKPIVVYHPTMNGEGISACDPVVLNSRKVGIMLNTKWENGRLKSEAWLDVDRANAVDDRIMKAVENKEMMEVSTGMFMELEDTSGKWKGEEYQGIARNFRADHLALLPDQIGACSIADGAGLLRNAAGKPTAESMEKLLKRIGLLDNESSFGTIQYQLSQALQERFPYKDGGSYAYVEDVYSNFFVYSYEGKCYRLSYMANDTGVKLSDETPIEVKRFSEWRAVSDGSVMNQNKPKIDMDKKTKVDGIISATNSVWKEEDREKLMGFNDAQLDLIKNNQTPAPAPAPAPAAPAPAPVAPAPAPEKKVITLAEYVAEAPAEVRDVLHDSIAMHSQEKTRMVGLIVAHESNSYTKEELEAKSLGELRKLARLCEKPAAPGQPVQNYAGQAPVPAAGGHVEEPMEIPVLNFAAK